MPNEPGNCTEMVKGSGVRRLIENDWIPVLAGVYAGNSL